MSLKGASKLVVLPKLIVILRTKVKIEFLYAQLTYGIFITIYFILARLPSKTAFSLRVASRLSCVYIS